MMQQLYKKMFTVTCFLVVYSIAFGQKLTYSEIDRTGSNLIGFDIIGKHKNQYLVCKQLKNLCLLDAFDTEMKLVFSKELNFLPGGIILNQIISFPDYFVMLYQHNDKQTRTMYAQAAKISNEGALLTPIINLDSIKVKSGFSDDYPFEFFVSENKQFIWVQEPPVVGQKYVSQYGFLYNNELTKIDSSKLTLPTSDKYTHYTDFQIDNGGNLYYLKSVYKGSNQSNLVQLNLLQKKINLKNPTEVNVNISGLYLDKPFLKIDNVNRKILINCFYAKQKKNSIEGIYSAAFDGEDIARLAKTNAHIFSEEYRYDARGRNTAKNAFDNYLIKNLLLKKDGSFFIIAEATYSNTRGVQNNRWTDWNRTIPYGLNAQMGYYNYYPYYYGNSWYSRYSPYYQTLPNTTTYYTDNIGIMSMDTSLKMEWSNLIIKSQNTDNDEDELSFFLANMGNKLFFLYNEFSAREAPIGGEYLDVSGKLEKNLPIKNIPKGYNFLIRKAKQVGLKQILIPCIYKNHLGFVRLDLP